MSSAFDESTFTAQKIIDFIKNVRLQRFNIINQIWRTAEKPTFSLHVDTTRSGLVQNVLNAFCQFLDSSYNRRRLECNIHIVIEFGRKIGSWSEIRSLLPLFAVGNNNSRNTDMPLEVLNCMRINFILSQKTTLKQKIDDWCKAANEADMEMLTQQQYKFAKIRLVYKMQITIDVTASLADEEQGEIDFWLKYIQNEIRQKINEFASDAVEACTRRDLSVWLYQSLESCKFEFVVLKFADKRTIFDVNAAFRADMARVEQQVSEELLSVAFDEAICSANVVKVPVVSVSSVAVVVPLPALRHVEVDVRCF